MHSPKPKSHNPPKVSMPAENVVTISVHDHSISPDPLISDTLFPTDTPFQTTLFRLISLTSSKGLATDSPLELGSDQGVIEARSRPPNDSYLFTAKPIPVDLRPKLPNAQLSLPQTLFSSWQLQKNSPALVSIVENEIEARATHVEIVFRDQYLTRSDMWRLISRQLAGRCVHRGQKLEFLGAIRANIRTIYCGRQKVNSAIYHASTKPIFRSESARFVLFIQMSREMWEFDTEGTGEIMFDKVVTGFLPELFYRWRQAQARHLVTIVLFTRMEPDNERSSTANEDEPENDKRNDTQDSPNASRDFYRVVVSDTASVESADILERLKREFQYFLSDISMRKPAPGEYAPLGSGLSAASAVLPDKVIAGKPSPAAKGNVLEAINLASSQFASDYIDRDLFRTGVSIMIITPGSGLYEVDHDLLIATTENLTDNGIGIDLICLSKMPLHSVPLFRYHRPSEDSSESDLHGAEADSHALMKYHSNTMSLASPSTRAPSEGRSKQEGEAGSKIAYGIPHWVDVSFWNTHRLDKIPEQQSQKSSASKAKKSSFEPQKHKPFKIRVRMYELQMMGITENATGNILLPRLSPKTSLRDMQSIRSRWQDRIRGTPPLTIEPSSPQLSSRGSTSGVHTPHSPGSSPQNHAPWPESKLDFSKWMDEHDESVFRGLRSKKVSRPRHLLSNGLRPSGKRVVFGKKSIPSDGSPSHDNPNSEKDAQSDAVVGNKQTLQTYQRAANSPARALKKPNPSQRKISFGPRGFGIAGPKVAAAVASTDNAVSRDIQLAKSSLSHDEKSAKTVAARNPKPESINQGRDTEGAASAKDQAREPSQTADQDSNLEASRPIPIEHLSANRAVTIHKNELPKHRDRLSALRDIEVEETSVPTQAEAFGPELPTLPPSVSLAPWLTVLNPCNPNSAALEHSHQLGKWQHVYPQPPKVSQIKWKSMCSPAAVPLTTEDFPDTVQWTNEYRDNSYIITLPEKDVSDAATSLWNELLAFRLSRGFQIVVGPRLAETVADASLLSLDIFNENLLSAIPSRIFMSRGNTIHSLKRVTKGELEVTIYLRHSAAKIEKLGDEAFTRYRPLVRSMLADSYEYQDIVTAPRRGLFNWESIDSFISRQQGLQVAKTLKGLRPWRARFVLVPMEAALAARRSSKPKELTEEENRIEGIRKLTQVWQKGRHVLSEERRLNKPSQVADEANPLDVHYFTKDLSDVVNEEHVSALLTNDAKTFQTPPESERFQRSNVNMAALAERLQGAKGVPLTDRRWHLKVHRHCLLGSDLTTWLLENFTGVSSRQEAVDIGNELMKNGVLKHVERRHDFRDGHYFYQIAEEYRGPRSQESKSIFRWGKNSVPPTPSREGNISLLSTPIKAESNANALQSPFDHVSMTRGDVQKDAVVLGSSLVYNLSQNRPHSFYRDEQLLLHYDRFYNPDNCYHLRLEWMNATPKLIQEALKNWSLHAESHGFRLVEVPVGEASAITSMHPFRAPYPVKLAWLPPSRTDSALRENDGPDPADNHFFQAAILKRFNYVLDFEPASAFPPVVEVSYSWGRPTFRYPQYVHRSGLLIAQVDNEGNFLLLANRLYNNRSASSRAKSSTEQAEFQAEHSMGYATHRSNPLKVGDALTQRAVSGNSNGNSPASSPVVRPVQSSDALNSPGPFSPSLKRQQHVSTPRFQNHAGGESAVLSPSPSTNSQHGVQASYSTPCHQDLSTADPELLTRQFQSFCSDASALETLYSECETRQKRKKSTVEALAQYQTPLLSALVMNGGGSVKSTPMTSASTALTGGSPHASTPSKIPKATEAGRDEDDIPALTLPGSVTEKLR